MKLIKILTSAPVTFGMHFHNVLYYGTLKIIKCFVH